MYWYTVYLIKSILIYIYFTKSIVIYIYHIKSILVPCKVANVVLKKVKSSAGGTKPVSLVGAIIKKSKLRERKRHDFVRRVAASCPTFFGKMHKTYSGPVAIGLSVSAGSGVQWTTIRPCRNTLWTLVGSLVPVSLGNHLSYFSSTATRNKRLSGWFLLRWLKR